MTKQIQDSFQFKNGLTMKNRVVMAPMTLGVCNPDGFVSEADLAYYARRSKAAGMMITGSAYVSPDGQAFKGSYSAAEDDKIDGLRRLAKAIQAEGSLAILQLYHGGRMVPPNLIENQPVAPSAVKAEHGFVETPRSLTHLEIHQLLADFLSAIERAIAAGFDGVELHGANTYLIQQFCSPHSNIRQDQWGGTPNNRLRFSKTLLKKAKQLVKEKATKPFLIGYRFSPEEIEEPGIQLFDTLQLLEQLIQLGVDYLHLSVYDVWQSSLRDTSKTEPLLYPILQKIDHRVPLIAVGGIRTGQAAQEVLEAGAPLVALGKALLLDPDWTEKVVAHQEAELIHTYRDELKEHLALPDAFVRDFRDFLENDS